MTESMKRKTRRGFLADGGRIAAGVMAAPYFIPSSVFANDKHPGANDRVVLAIIGMGTRGNQLADNMPEGAQIAAICDCDSKQTSEALKRHEASWDTYQDYREMLDRKDIDSVIVCPTDPHHVLASILACQAGKDVYCEKPVSLTIGEGRALVKAARRYERVVQVGTQQRTMEMNRFACELVRDGGIGKVTAVECVSFRSPERCPGFPAEPIPAGLDWNLWMGPTPDRPYNKKIHTSWWGQWRAYAGHMMTFLGAHAFDMVQYQVSISLTCVQARHPTLWRAHHDTMVTSSPTPPDFYRIPNV